MKCDKCDNEATVTVKTILNGEEKNFHLCNDCLMKFTDVSVDENGNIKEGGENLDRKNIESLIEEFLPSLEEVIDSYYDYRFKENNYSYGLLNNLGDEACPTCGNLSSNIKHGVFACPDCYKLNDKLTTKTLRTYNNLRTYEGKFPRKERNFKDIATKIKNLQEKLQVSVEIEDYEQAQSLKEQIDELNMQVRN